MSLIKKKKIEAFDWPSEFGRINQTARPLAGSTRLQTVGRINQAANRWQDQPGSRPLAGSTRLQIFEMEMKMKMKIKMKMKMNIKYQTMRSY